MRSGISEERRILVFKGQTINRRYGDTLLSALEKPVLRRSAQAPLR
jgi:hypothetical protein